MQKYIDFRNEIDYEKLNKAANLIKDGKLVVFPTETVYGIGTNGLDKNAIKISDIKMIEKVAKNISDMEYKLMKAFFPGPLTIILNKKDIVPDILTANGSTVGVRMPEGKIARELVKCADVPIAAPSANISGKPSGTNLQDIQKDFEKSVDCFIDGGKSKLGIASTIVKVVNNIPHILRVGSISKEEIEKIAGKVIIEE